MIEIGSYIIKHSLWISTWCPTSTSKSSQRCFHKGCSASAAHSHCPCWGDGVRSSGIASRTTSSSFWPSGLSAGPWLDGFHYRLQLGFRAQLFNYFLDFFQLHVVGDDPGFVGILKLREEVDEFEQHLAVFQLLTQFPQKLSLSRRSSEDWLVLVD